MKNGVTAVLALLLGVACVTTVFVTSAFAPGSGDRPIGPKAFGPGARTAGIGNHNTTGPTTGLGTEQLDQLERTMARARTVPSRQATGTAFMSPVQVMGKT